MKSLFPCLSMLLLVACTSDTEDTADSGDTLADCTAPYAPFDAANYDNQVLRVGAYEQIVAIRKSDDFAAADFDEIESLYVDTASLSQKVEGRTDDHDWASVEAIGPVLHGAITDAIAAGKADTEIKVQGQIIDKTLQNFFALSIFHEGTKSDDDAKTLEEAQAGWDEAFGYFGISNDGQDTTGISNTLSKRDVEFGTSLTDGVFNALVDGRCALEGGDREGALEARDEADLAILQGFALSVVHEMDAYDEDPLIKGWEGYLYWLAVADHVAHLDPTAHDTIAAEWEAGVDGIDASAVRAAVVDAYGFDL